VTTNKTYPRFSLSRRIEHWLTAVSFIVLAGTGLAQKYSASPLALTLLKSLGGLETSRLIHRVAAVVLAVVAIYHFGYMLYLWYVQGHPATMLPTGADLRNAWQAFLYNLGLRKQPPRQGYYTFDEKFEYWALVWGTGVMVVTGFFMWNPLTAARYLPGEFIPAAKAAHGGEALLAVLSIAIWHMYHVLVKHFNPSMFTGCLPMPLMEEEHPLALENPPRPAPRPPAERQRRKRRFWLGYGAAALLWALSVVWFVTSEQSAIAAPPPPPDLEGLQAYAPLPTATAAPESLPPQAAHLGSTWENGIGELLNSRCGMCHHPSGQNSLDLTSYAGALQGGDSGPAVVPGSPGASLALIWPSLPTHRNRLSSLERQALRAWILAGAPER